MRDRRDFLKNAILLGAGFSLASGPSQASNLNESNLNRDPLFTADLETIRNLANVIVGDLPQSLNVIRVADTTRPANIVVRGADPNKTIKLERTAYQMQYSQGTIMIDSGMDEATHNEFGKGGNFYPESYQRLLSALDKANMIVLSHYHGDHIGGVVRSANFDKLAPKVWACKHTAELMVNKPHKSTLSVSKQQVNRFIVSEFDKYQPIAPGLVAIRAPGHSPDSKMFYIKLKSGKEFIHTVDTGWSMQNILTQRMKNASWVNEDEKQIMAQFTWLNQVMETEENITVLSSHDADQYVELRRNGVLGDI